MHHIVAFLPRAGWLLLDYAVAGSGIEFDIVHTVWLVFSRIFATGPALFRVGFINHGAIMTIRKRSALLLGLVGFLSGVVFAQYQRRQLLKVVPHAMPVMPDKGRQIPMQVVDQTLATARQNRNKSGYTTH